MTTEQTQEQPKTRPYEVRSDALLDAKKTMIRALRCLYIAVEKDVADDVVAKVRAYTDMLEASNARLDRPEGAMRTP